MVPAPQINDTRATQYGANNPVPVVCLWQVPIFTVHDAPDLHSAAVRKHLPGSSVPSPNPPRPGVGIQRSQIIMSDHAQATAIASLLSKVQLSHSIWSQSTTRARHCYQGECRYEGNQSLQHIIAELSLHCNCKSPAGRHLLQ